MPKALVLQQMIDTQMHACLKNTRKKLSPPKSPTKCLRRIWRRRHHETCGFSSVPGAYSINILTSRVRIAPHIWAACWSAQFMRIKRQHTKCTNHHWSQHTGWNQNAIIFPLILRTSCVCVALRGQQYSMVIWQCMCVCVNAVSYNCVQHVLRCM